MSNFYEFMIAETVRKNQEIQNLHTLRNELLGILREMVADEDFLGLCQGIGHEPEWLNKARTAIAVAEGRAR